MIIVVVICIIGFSCSSKAPKKPVIKFKYTIWTGAILGKGTNEYVLKDGLVTLRLERTGKTVIIPIENINEIEVN